MKVLLTLCCLVATASAVPFLSNLLQGYRPTTYTSLDLSQVDMQAARNSGHQEYITVADDDFSGEAEVYKLVGVAPSSAVSGGSATTYSANIANTVPIYKELDDYYEDSNIIRYLSSRPQATVYSAQGGASQQPLRIRAKTTLAGNSFAVLLDD